MTGLRLLREVREHVPMAGRGGRGGPARPTVTIVAHDASNTGAPAVLASLLRWRAGLTRPVDGGVDVVLLAGGPGVSELAGLAPVRFHSGDAADRVSTALALGGRGLASVGAPAVVVDAIDHLHATATRRLLAPDAGDVVVASTLAALPAAAAIAGAHRRLVCHVHELDGVADRILPRGRARDRVTDRVDLYLAAGRHVATMLVDRWAIAPDRVTVIDDFVDESPVSTSTGPSSAEARAVIGGRPGRPVVVSVGRAGPRKGTDLFVGLMATLASHPTLPTGAWIGGDPSGAAWHESVHDIGAAGLDGRVLMVPDLPDARPPMAAADIVVSTAREDPYPLAVIEAALARRPVVAFASGGVIDMFEDAGLPEHLVPPGDILGMASLVGELLDDPDRAQDCGSRLASWAERTHLTRHWAPRWWDAVLATTGRLA